MTNFGRNRPPDVKVNRAEQVKNEKTLPIAGWLLVLNGKHKGEDFRLREGRNIVGTDPDCEVRLTEEMVSAKHASIMVKRASDTTGAYSITDLDSTNGTFLNQDESVSKAELVDNDVVVFGQTRCKFKCV